MTNFDKHIKQVLGDLIQNHSPDDWLAMDKLLTDTAFDQQITNKLNSFEETITPTEIQLFDSFLADKALDTFIQQKFELIEAAEMEPDWEDFETVLDSHNFDAQVSSKIGEMAEVAVPLADWNLFEQQLNTNTFDGAVHDKLATHTVPYRNRDWVAMRRLLEGLNPQGNYIWEKTKRLLPLLLLLLLMGGGAYWYTTLEDKKEVVTTVPQQKTERVPEKENFASVEADAKISQQNGIVVEGYSKDRSKPALTPPLNTSKEVNKMHSSTSDNRDSHANNSIVSENASLAKIEPTTIIANAVLPKEVVSTENKETSTQVPAIENNELLTPTVAMPTANSQEPTAKITIQKSPYQNYILTTKPITHELNYQLKEGKEDIWNPQIAIGAYTSVLGSVVELNDTIQVGTSYGLRTELSLNQKWSLTTDILYGKRNFQTQYYKLYNPTNSMLQHLLIGNITSIDIPIMLKRKWNLTKKDNFAIYMQAGAIPTISIDENYTHYDPTTIENISKNWEGNLREMAPVQQSFHFKPYMGNIIVAPGLQYKVGSLRIQAEPRFQWAIQSLSLENKKVHSIGFGVSAVYILGK